jgi:hypothetical protein
MPCALIARGTCAGFATRVPQIIRAVFPCYAGICISPNILLCRTSLAKLTISGDTHHIGVTTNEASMAYGGSAAIYGSNHQHVYHVTSLTQRFLRPFHNHLFDTYPRAVDILPQLLCTPYPRLGTDQQRTHHISEVSVCVCVYMCVCVCAGVCVRVRRSDTVVTLVLNCCDTVVTLLS